MRPITLTEPGTVLPESELILNPDGSVYHIALRPEQLGDIVLVVGDPGRVARISERFDRIDHQGQNREFVAHTGTLRGRRITALATGIGTDNIDIVVGELDALVNIDLATRTPKKEQRALTIVRLGTCGALQEDIPVDYFIVSHSALGLDNVLHYYAHENTDPELRLLQAVLDHTEWPGNLPLPYIAFGDQALTERLGHGNHTGITATSGGFYGPQGRQLRAVPSVDGLNDAFSSFRYPAGMPGDELRITNYEMETSALYGPITTEAETAQVGTISANGEAAIGRMIDQVLERLVG